VSTAEKKQIVIRVSGQFQLIFGGMIVIFVTIIAGIWISLATSEKLKLAIEGKLEDTNRTVIETLTFLSFGGGIIGAAIGSLLWYLLVKAVSHNKKSKEIPAVESLVMSPTEKTLIVIFGGIILIVLTTFYGAVAGLYLVIDNYGPYAINLYVYPLLGGGIGAAVGVATCCLLVRNKNTAARRLKN
tara:strand:- start:38 stop:595 length:558 start_codon:yes stop_codon:yes gene_type:complete